MANDGSTVDRARVNRDLLPTVVLATCFVIAIFAIAMPILLLNTNYTQEAAPFAPQKQSAETALYLLAIVALTPAVILMARFVVGRINAGPNRDCLTGLSAAITVPLGFGLLMIRHSAGLPWGEGVKATLVLGLVWSAIAAVLILPAMRKTQWRFASPIATGERWLLAAAGAATVAAVLSVVRFGHVDWLPLAVAVAVAGLVVWAYLTFRPRRLMGRWGIAVDLVIALVIALAVPDMLIYEPGAGDFNTAFHNYVTEYHQSLFIGAASQVLHGSALLVGTVSQYGVGSVYLVVGFFEMAPIGYLTLGFFEGILSALMFALAYGILRMAGVTRMLAAAAMAVAVVTLIWGLEYPMGALLQHGAIRFGLPMPLIAAVVAATRWPRSRPVMKWLALAVTGISSIWALEGFIYVSATVAAMILIGVTWVPSGTRIRWLLKVTAAVIGSWIVTQIVFALITLLASGSLPEWGLYITYLREFLTGDIGDLTYDMSPWTPGLAVFGSYIVSAIVIVQLTITRRDFTAARQPAFFALTGLTAYGVILFSYFDNRSLDHILPYCCPPALMALSIWLALALDNKVNIPKVARVSALSSALALSALMIASVWPAAGHRGQDSLLAYALPGGKSLGDGLHRIWNPPPLKPQALSGQRLIEKYMPGEDKVPVLTVPDLDNEILARTDRANELRITDAKEASWVPGPHRPEVEQAAKSLDNGDRVLFDSYAWKAYRLIEPDPQAALSDPNAIAAKTSLQAIQVEAIAWIAENHSVKTVSSSGDGLSVVELQPRD